MSPAPSTPLLIPWQAQQPVLQVVLLVVLLGAFTTVADLEAGSVCLAKECFLESAQICGYVKLARYLDLMKKNLN